MARNCANILTHIQSDRSFVVGLAGPWGSGKTSFLNLVKEALRSESDTPIIVDFNAWLYSTQEQLVKQFFLEIKRAIGLSTGERIGDRAANEIGSALTDYAETISDEGTSLMGAALTLVAPQLTLLQTIPGINKAGKHALRRMSALTGNALKNNEKTVEQQRAVIVKKLSAIQRNILVVIDDVDRLPKEDICALFKLVNLTASFPKMTFLLSYDIKVVTEALGEIQGIDGGSYLEKIVQLPLALPPAPHDILHKQLADVLGSYINSCTVFRIDDQEQRRLLGVFEGLVEHQAKTPRQIKRYLNTFNTITPAIKDEICPTDTIGLVGLHVFLPNTYDWLWEHKDEICTLQHASYESFEANERSLKTSLINALEQDSVAPGNVCQTLGLLFPTIATWFQSHPSNSAIIARETGRVACVQNFELFKFMGTGSDTKRIELYRLTFLAELNELSYGIIKLDSQGQLSRLVEFMDLNRSNISIARRETIVSALLKTIGGISQMGDGGFFTRPTIEKVTRLASGFLIDIGMSAADQLIMQCVNSFKNRDFIALSWFIKDENLAQTGESMGAACISQDVYQHLARAFVNSIVDHFPNVLRIPGHPAQFLWRHIDKKLDGNALEEVREKYSSDAELRVLCASAALAHWYGSGGSGFGYSPSDHQGYEPVLPLPTAEDVKEFGLSNEFALLPEEVRARVASLYLLLSKGVLSNDFTTDEQVTYSTALALVQEWAQ